MSYEQAVKYNKGEQLEQHTGAFECYKLTKS